MATKWGPHIEVGSRHCHRKATVRNLKITQESALVVRDAPLLQQNGGYVGWFIMEKLTRPGKLYKKLFKITIYSGFT